MNAKQRRVKTSGAVVRPVSGLQRFTVNRLNEDVGAGIFGSDLAVYDGLLRPDIEDNPYCMFKTTIDGKDWLEFFVNPTAEPSYLPTTNGFANHFRSEISPYPWNQKYALGTEYWKGISFHIPAGVVQHVDAHIPIIQFKDGSAGGDPSPAMSIELAYPGQLNSSTIYRKTPLGGEVMMVCDARDSKTRWTPPDSEVRLVAGGRLDVIVQVVFNTDGTGLFKTWLNSVHREFPGYTTGGDTFAPGDYGSTVNGDYGPGFGPLGSNPKHGLYCLQYKTPELVAANALVGHNQMRLLTTDWNTVTRTPADWDYLSNNAYNAVDTSRYNL